MLIFIEGSVDFNIDMATLVYDLKSVGALKIEFVAPIPEQISTYTMHFSNVSGGPYQKLPAQKLGELGHFSVQFAQIFGWQLLICAS